MSYGAGWGRSFADQLGNTRMQFGEYLPSFRSCSLNKLLTMEPFGQPDSFLGGSHLLEELSSVHGCEASTSSVRHLGVTVLRFAMLRSWWVCARKCAPSTSILGFTLCGGWSRFVAHRIEVRAARGLGRALRLQCRQLMQRRKCLMLAGAVDRVR